MAELPLQSWQDQGSDAGFLHMGEEPFSFLGVTAPFRFWKIGSRAPMDAFPMAGHPFTYLAENRRLLGRDLAARGRTGIEQKIAALVDAIDKRANDLAGLSQWRSLSL
jgi:hypothetical protein